MPVWWIAGQVNRLVVNPIKGALPQVTLICIDFFYHIPATSIAAQLFR